VKNTTHRQQQLLIYLETCMVKPREMPRQLALTGMTVLSTHRNTTWNDKTKEKCYRAFRNLHIGTGRHAQWNI